MRIEKYKGAFFKVVLFLLLFTLIKNQGRTLDYFTAKKFSLFSGDHSTKYERTGGYSTSVVWTHPIQDIATSSLVFAAFARPNINVRLSFTAKLINVTNTGGVINYNPVGSEIILADFYVLITSKEASGYMELINCHSDFIVLSLPSRNSHKEYFTVNSTFLFDNPSNFKASIGYTSLIHISIPTGQYQEITTGLDKIWNGTNRLSVWFYSYKDYQNQISSIDYVVTIICVIKIQPQLLIYWISLPGSPSQNIPLNMRIPSIFGQWFEENCYFGLAYILFNASSSNCEVSFVEDSNLTITSVRIQNVTYVYFEGFCLTQCMDNRTTYDPASSNPSCAPCQSFMADCKTCTNSTRCTSCLPLNFLQTSSKCVSCQTAIHNCKYCLTESICNDCYLGLVVEGGCSDMPGCTKVKQENQYQLSINSQCVACEEPQSYLSEGKCKCSGDGWIITGHCTNNYGCLSLKRVNNALKCIFCDPQNLFELNATDQCSCRNNLILVNGKCLDICGNAKVFQQDCDDGNTQDGDGCSSICKIEKFYKCYNGSEQHQSNCIYLGHFKIKQTIISKEPSKNQAILVVIIDPVVSAVGKMNLSKYFSFISNQTTNVSKITYENGAITFFIDFQSNLEGKNGFVTLSFDESLIIRQRIQLNINMTSSGQSLRVYNQYDLIKMKNPTIIICFGAVLILIASFISHKMIGVEIFNTIQIIYLLHYITSEYTSILAGLQTFTYLAANVLYPSNSKISLFTSIKHMKFSHNSHNQFVSELVISIPLLSGLIVLIIGQIIKRQRQIDISKYQAQNLISKRQSNKSLAEQMVLIVYKNAIYPFAIAFSFVFYMLIGMQAINSQNIKEGIHLSVWSLTKFVTLMGIIWIFFSEWKILFTKRTYKKQKLFGLTRCSIYYIPAYLTYNFLVFILISAAYFDIFHRIHEIIACSSLLAVIFIACSKPYYSISHNVGIILNHLLIGFFAFWMAFRENYPVLTTETYQINFIIATCAFIIACLCYSIFRIILSYIQEKKFTIQVKSHEKKEFDFQKDEIQLELQEQKKIQKEYLKKVNLLNPYHLLTNLKKQKLNTMYFENRARILQKNDAIYLPNQFDIILDKMKQKKAKQFHSSKLNSNHEYPQDEMK